MFNYDNKVFEFINRVVDTMFATLLWVVFSLPIITLGASTTAFYETVHKVLRKNKGYIWRTFWNTFITNFMRSTIVWLIQAALSLFFLLDMKIMKEALAQGEKGGWLYYFFMFSLIVMYAWFIFNCAYIARIEDGVKKTLKNTALMMIMNLQWAGLMFVTAFAAFAVIAFVPVSALFVPTGVMFIYDLIILKVFNKYINMDDEEKVEEVDGDEVVMHDIAE
jgi:uncharacterized membrane protein YesL